MSTVKPSFIVIYLGWCMSNLHQTPDMLRMCVLSNAKRISMKDAKTDSWNIPQELLLLPHSWTWDCREVDGMFSCLLVRSDYLFWWYSGKFNAFHSIAFYSHALLCLAMARIRNSMICCRKCPWFKSNKAISKLGRRSAHCATLKVCTETGSAHINTFNN